MLELFRKKNAALLGVDISSNSVKLLELSKQGRKYKVLNYISRPVPENAVVEKNIADLEAVGDVFFKLSSLVKTTTRNAAVAVSGSAVITKIIEMSAGLKDAEMESQISIEADQYIPYPLDEVAIDFERQRISPKNPDMVEVLLAACKKENVDLRVAALEMGGFNTKVVDIEAYAVERAYRLLLDQMNLQEEPLVAIFDIGATMTTLYILRDGVSIYTRDQFFGGDELQRMVQNRYELEPNEVLPAIIEGKLPETFEPEILEPFKESITEQISRSLQFFFSSSQYNDVNLIILAGGTAKTRGLAAMVEEGLSCRTVVANPFAKMLFGSRVNKALLRNDAASLLIASGLAIRGL